MERMQYSAKLIGDVFGQQLYERVKEKTEFTFPQCVLKTRRTLARKQ